MATAKRSKKTNRQPTERISKSGDQQASPNEPAREEIERRATKSISRVAAPTVMTMTIGCKPSASLRKLRAAMQTD